MKVQSPCLAQGGPPPSIPIPSLSVCQPVSNTQAVSPSSGLPFLLLQGHFYATRGHHVAPALLSSLSPPPYPPPPAESTAMSPALRGQSS